VAACPPDTATLDLVDPGAREMAIGKNARAFR